MKKIKNHYKECIKVLKSCTTKEQLVVAFKYAKLVTPTCTQDEQENIVRTLGYMQKSIGMKLSLITL